VSRRAERVLWFGGRVLVKKKVGALAENGAVTSVRNLGAQLWLMRDTCRGALSKVWLKWRL
jgi:hypothetical protein